jgi:organic anion transporter 4A
VIGPALGYVIGGQFLELYVDFYEVSESLRISSKDPNWVGAWWLGFIFVWALSWICGIFLFLYPATLPNNKTTFPRKRTSVPNSIENKCLKTYHNSNELLKSPGTGDTASSMIPKSNDSIRNVMNEASNRIIQLMSNPSYVLLVLGGGLDSIMVIGLGTFLPKFIMSQYGFSASVSAVIMGIIITPSGGLGTLTGGYLVKKFKMSREQILKMYIYCQIVAIPCLFAFVFYCEDAKFAGVNVSYNQTIGHGTLVTEHQNTWSSVNLSANCNANCGECGGVGKYEPVCGDDGLIYLNSCYAGCEEFIYTDNSTAGDYTKCSCVQEKFKVQGGGGSGQMEMCNVECQKNFFLLVSFLFIVIWVSLMSGMSCIVCIMRFVEPENKSLSMGIAFIIAR